MLNKKEFIAMRKEYDMLDQKREETIQKSREIIKLSKLIIYSLHRDDIKTASQHVAKIKQELQHLKNIDIKNIDVTIYLVAFQEYAESLTFYHFITENKIPSAKQLGLDSESYLLGICDLTGELVRKAVNSSIKKKYGEVENIKNLVEEIYGEFLQFNLRNSELRKKSDQIKWSLAKLEDLVFEINRNK